MAIATVRAIVLNILSDWYVLRSVPLVYYMYVDIAIARSQSVETVIWV